MAGDRVQYTILIKPEDHIIYGADRISKIIKKSPNDIPFLVKERGLKAWQEGPKAKWRALCQDLLEFNMRQKEGF